MKHKSVDNMDDISAGDLIPAVYSLPPATTPASHPTSDEVQHSFRTDTQVVLACCTTVRAHGQAVRNGCGAF